ncbi:hypothetical protein Lalb_Chr03g0042841 [Lupinus albus]|uniref:Uncharacterized protein n=1 Tax=Lupinus albus TaxID=3870 RepID=A0A6A4QTH4_LUPAL|nr:hypothetical protein Lalb_Chr03g0042841 [Lupinus albus]
MGYRGWLRDLRVVNVLGLSFGRGKCGECEFGREGKGWPSWLGHGFGCVWLA